MEPADSAMTISSHVVHIDHLAVLADGKGLLLQRRLDGVRGVEDLVEFLEL